MRFYTSILLSSLLGHIGAIHFFGANYSATLGMSPSQTVEQQSLFNESNDPQCTKRGGDRRDECKELAEKILNISRQA